MYQSGPEQYGDRCQLSGEIRHQILARNGSQHFMPDKPISLVKRMVMVGKKCNARK